MTNVVIYHSVLGIRQGERDAAERLRGQGHQVWLPDLFDGVVFDAYEPAMEASQAIGNDELNARALRAAEEVPDGFVVAGFSQGSGLATYVATQRRVSGVLQLSGLTLLEWLGPDAAWPAGVDSQGHQTLGDPFRDPVEEQARLDVTAAGGELEIFDYPGSGHLFTDPTLTAEYDGGATELLWTRVLPFVAERGGTD